MIVSKSFRWNKYPAFAALVGAVVMFFSAYAQSDESTMDTLQVHGFLSQALIVTDHNNFFGPSSQDEGSFKFTEIGLNASLRPHQDVLLAAQMLSRRAGGSSSDAHPELDYGLIDYQMISDQQRTFGIQLGRFKNPFGFYNQTRDVAFTRPSILLPQSIYFDRTRSLGLSGDGISLYHEERLSSGVLRTQVGIGQAQAGEDLQSALRLEDVPGTLSAKQSAIGQIRYEHDGGRIIAALSTAQAKARFDSNIPEQTDVSFRFRPVVLSLQYNEELWSLTGEFALRPTKLGGVENRWVNDVTGESWYLQYARRFADEWQWLVRYDSLTSNRADRSGKSFEESTGGSVPAHTQFADDLTFGLQWVPHPQVMLAGEYHHVDGTGWLPIQDNPDSSATSRRWNMWLLQLSLRF
ncbi:hypothetical protein QEN58_13285 [Halomonas alkaliantarctica]|uniref:Phosphate-selective porin O/P n=1 Tax=Halomonas alkaliantarctica TaxID=232346 RepID=A0ABY8LLV7_9GAMM|nr:hypothetical protein [Halomonas alkaliantarctica]WGI24302.1 hypothetical protein QEN58_13285 [Halomonas alkaliantarctica]